MEFELLSSPLCGDSPSHSPSPLSATKLTSIDKMCSEIGMEVSEEEMSTLLVMDKIERLKANSEWHNLCIRSDEIETIHKAIKYSDCEQIKTLVASGINVDTKTKTGITGLHLSVMLNQLSTSCTFLELGANIEEKTRKGDTPLHIAIKLNFYNIVVYLLRFGADTRSLDSHGNNSLTIAENVGNLDLINHLLVVVWGLEPIHLKARLTSPFYNQFRTCLRVYCMCRESKVKGHYMQCPFWKDCAYLLEKHEEFVKRNIDEMKALIDSGVNVNQITKGGTFGNPQNTPLHYAAMSAGNEKKCKLLVELGASVALANVDGNTPLHIAIQMAPGRDSNRETCEDLIARGANVNATNAAVDSPLHLAIRSRSIETFMYLIRNGANQEQRNAEGKTPKFVAQEIMANENDVIAKKIVDLFYGSNNNQYSNPETSPVPSDFEVDESEEYNDDDGYEDEYNDDDGYEDEGCNNK